LVPEPLSLPLALLLCCLPASCGTVCNERFVLRLVDDNVSCAEDSDIPRAEKECYLVAP